MLTADGDSRSKRGPSLGFGEDKAKRHSLTGDADGKADLCAHGAVIKSKTDHLELPPVQAREQKAAGAG
jgi:hypothetical protein